MSQPEPDGRGSQAQSSVTEPEKMNFIDQHADGRRFISLNFKLEAEQ